jgi:hypothetical protein
MRRRRFSVPLMRSWVAWSRQLLDFIVAAALLCTPSACSNRSAVRKSNDSFNVLQELGYEPAISGRTLVEGAISNCNLILDPTLNLRIQPSWLALPVASPSPSDRILLSSTQAEINGIPWRQTTELAGGFYSLSSQPRVDSSSPIVVIPVYLVTGGSLNDDEISFVPSGSKCIIVNSPGLKHVASLLHPAGARAAIQTELRFALTLILLHEIGHIVNGDAGAFTQPFVISDLNDSLNSAQNRELKADLFAVTQIQRASKSGLIAGRLPAAMNVAAEITGVVFDMLAQEIENVRHHQPLPAASYLDHGYAHPNIELRFLIMAYKYNPSPLLLEQIQEFVNSRTKPAAPTGTPPTG